MTFPFSILWWIYPPPKDPVPAPPEEFPCPKEEIEEEEEEEEEDDICWGLGELILLYCLAVAILKILYIFWHKYLLKCRGGIRSTCGIMATKGNNCECECRVCFHCILNKLFGEGEVQQAKDPPSRSSSVKPPTKKRPRSKCSQPSGCNSDSSIPSWDSEFLTSRASQGGDSRSFSSSKYGRTSQKQRPKERSLEEPSCLRCKAEITREWLAQHFEEQ